MVIVVVVVVVGASGQFRVGHVCDVVGGLRVVQLPVYLFRRIERVNHVEEDVQLVQGLNHLCRLITVEKQVYQL